MNLLFLATESTYSLHGSGHFCLAGIVNAFMYKVGITALILQVVILIVIMLVSRRLTKSVRRLEDEISNVQLESVLSPPIGLRAGDEIYRLRMPFHA